MLVKSLHLIDRLLHHVKVCFLYIKEFLLIILMLTIISSHSVMFSLWLSDSVTVTISCNI
jgi:hypothetical protein